MARELRIGDRVRTPAGVGVAMRPIGREGQPPLGYCVGYAEREFWLDHDAASVEPLPPDVSRERVKALHAAVTARLEQLDASRAATWYASEKDIFAACHSDLSEVAEALRLLLEVDP